VQVGKKVQDNQQVEEDGKAGEAVRGGYGAG